MKPVDPRSEQIARLIPKRNIETWILCLNEQVVDEQIDYKQSGNAWSKLIPSAAEKLHRWIRSSAKPPDRCVDSLRHGIEELRRLKI